MSQQDKTSQPNDTEKTAERTIVTGSHIAPKGHGAQCPCCMPEDDEDE